MTQDLRYPVGRFSMPSAVSAAERTAGIAAIESAPAELRRSVTGLSDAQLDTPYRPGGWTVRQLVHHVPDSHINAYVRFKLGLTEDEPTIKSYEEARWAELPDSSTTPVESSLRMLELLHERWTVLLRAMDDAAFSRTIRHPDWGAMPLEALLMLYAWHGAHHAAHVRALREREGW